MSIKIVYRKGYPTKKSLFQLIEEYGVCMHRLNPAQDYTTASKKLVWSSCLVQENIESFIQYANAHGIEFDKLEPYEKENCRVGFLFIKKK